mgnify:CR=1 FL=1
MSCILIGWYAVSQNAYSIGFPDVDFQKILKTRKIT